MARSLFLLRELVKRDLQGRYSGSLLGFFWALVQPLWQFVLFTFVFSTVMRVSPVGERTASFAVFLFSGLLPWLAFHETLVRSSTAITDNAALIKKVTFPSEILVLAVAVSALVQEALALGVFAAVLAARGEMAWSGLPWLLVAVPLQLALAIGLGLLLAGAQVFVRDVAPVVGLVLSGWFYLTPIVYPLGLVPERYRSWIAVNPLTTVVGLYRSALLGAPPGASVVPALQLALLSGVVLSAGLLAFRRLRPAFVDSI